MNAPVKRKPLGELLKDKGIIQDGHIDYALQEQKVTRERLGEVLQRLGFVTEYEIATTTAEQEQLPYLELSDALPEERALRLFNKNLCLNNQFLPIKREDSRLQVAPVSTDTQRLRQTITRQTGLQPDFYVVDRTKLVNAIHNYYYFLEHPVESLIETEVRVLSGDTEGVRPVDKLLEHIFHLAVKYRASDIHIRPMEKSVNVALRVDGVMRSMFSLPSQLKRVVSSVKMRAGMDIAEQRLPQDGSFTETILNNDYYFRASTTVVPFGENLVLRVLPLQGAFMGMNQLGFLEDDVRLVKTMFNEPYGIVLLTGPTGSGKTSTLYAALLTMDMLGKNIMTVENPIEYRFPLLRQTQVNTKAGYTFANAIRYFLRHDPDVMLVGEIRDEETAGTAFSASETGHLVLSTLHTNSAFGAIPRLQTLGVPAFVLADSLVGVVSQRLVRRICPSCKVSYTASQAEREYLGLPELDRLYRGPGCQVCGHTGYVGRTLIYEILGFDRELATLLREGGTQLQLEQVAASHGFKDMFGTARAKVVLGITTVAEMQRVLGHIAGTR